MERADLLLEIGSEEIPAGYIAPAVSQLRTRLVQHLADCGIEVDASRAEDFATPRRLAVLLRDVPLHQPVRRERRLGPAVKAAFDADGNPTPAATGFARSAGVEVQALQRIETDKGERLGVEVEVGGASTRELLLREGLLRQLLNLGFPKTMRWIPGDDLAYARPIRWLVCLLGDETVPLRLAHLEAGRTSRGHRTLAPGAVEIPRAGEYAERLAAAHVLARPSDREERILDEARRLADEAGGRLFEDPELLAEVAQLVEHPHGICGSYAARLVETLPREVIITALRAHQRYFSVEDAEGRLLPCFITFRDGGDRGLENVLEGNQRVLRARLDDALFYWDEDRSHDSEAKLAQLEKVVWLEGFGSVRDKCGRIATLAERLRETLVPRVDPSELRRAALLCKSDLATEMIKDGKEFTKLQGVMGRYYALEAGETPSVALAIEEHLRPRSASDRLPEGELATLVAVADRLDSIVGCVLAGFAPTGGQDPYALRRQALAVLRILDAQQWHLDLEDWVGFALDGYPGADGREAAQERSLTLFWGRLETVLGDLPAEIVRAVLSVSALDAVENQKAARALAALGGSEAFAMLLEGAKRCRNILVKEGRLAEEQLDGPARARRLRERAAERWGAWQAHATAGGAMAFDPERFVESGEEGLRAAAVEAIPALSEALGAGDHRRLYELLAGLGRPIADYFDQVLVNAKEPEIRANRLDFLEEIHYLFARFADLSRVPGSAG